MLKQTLITNKKYFSEMYLVKFLRKQFCTSATYQKSIEICSKMYFNINN